MEVDTASKQERRSYGLGCTLTALVAALDADACVIDSLHLTSARSEERSIYQISARNTTAGCVCVCACLTLCVLSKREVPIPCVCVYVFVSVGL